ncbi:MAG: polysaccharide deacetylase family protein [Cyanobacteria bacterium REEB459]|nr:polysaccharide deacetylase family protein [Cyanobacteria bacterium REEB459]
MPLLASFGARIDQPPLRFSPNLQVFNVAAGLDAFPMNTSSDRLCQAGASLAEQADQLSLSLFHGGSLGQSASILSQAGVTQLAVAPWPTIHPQAVQARVPVLMYHDVLETPQVSFDLLPAQFERQLQELATHGFTIISVDRLIHHLRSGAALPDKPVVLTLDDGYLGHFQYVYPLLQKYRVPALLSVFPDKVDGKIVGRSTLSWEQLKIMAADPLITIASHSLTHPADLRKLDDQQLTLEVKESKRRLEEKLGIPIHYFTYPAGHYDDRIAQAVANQGYIAAFTMRDNGEQFAGASQSLLAIERFGQSNLERLLTQAWGGAQPSGEASPTIPAVSQPPVKSTGFDFHHPITVEKHRLDNQALTLITGGRPVTIHAHTRAQLPEILSGTNAAAAVDGGFFSLKYLNSNVMVGPILSQSTRQFTPGNPVEIARLNNRPLVLITPNQVKFVPFDSNRHNSLAGFYQTLPGVTDGFVAAAWLVKDGQAQPASTFGTLFDFDARRHRAFWGINQAGQPVIGVSHTMIDSIQLGQLLQQSGLQNAVMLDSGASTSLTYQGNSLVGYQPRPVPHVVALLPPEASKGICPLVMAKPPESPSTGNP